MACAGRIFAEIGESGIYAISPAFIYAPIRLAFACRILDGEISARFVGRAARFTARLGAVPPQYLGLAPISTCATRGVPLFRARSPAFRHRFACLAGVKPARAAFFLLVRLRNALSVTPRDLPREGPLFATEIRNLATFVCVLPAFRLRLTYVSPVF